VGVDQMVDQEARDAMTVRGMCVDAYEKDSVMMVLAAKVREAY